MIGRPTPSGRNLSISHGEDDALAFQTLNKADTAWVPQELSGAAYQFARQDHLSPAVDGRDGFHLWRRANSGGALVALACDRGCPPEVSGGRGQQIGVHEPSRPPRAPPRHR